MLHFLGRNRHSVTQHGSEKETNLKEDEGNSEDKKTNKDKDPRISNKRLRASGVDPTDSDPDKKRPRIEITAVASIPGAPVTTQPATRGNFGSRRSSTSLQLPYEPHVRSRNTNIDGEAYVHGTLNLAQGSPGSLSGSLRQSNFTGRAGSNAALRPYEQVRAAPASIIQLPPYCCNCGFDLRGLGHVCPGCGYQRMVNGRPIHDIDDAGRRIQGHVVLRRGQNPPQITHAGYGVGRMHFVDAPIAAYGGQPNIVNGYVNPNYGTQDTFHVPQY